MNLQNKKLLLNLHEIGNLTFELVRRVTNTKLAKIGKLTTKFAKVEEINTKLVIIKKGVGNNQLSLQEARTSNEFRTKHITKSCIKY